jgi:hypothetical protein
MRRMVENREVCEMPLVIIESPFNGNGDTETNIKFARACMREVLLNGEAPFASHLLYTQEGILNDKIPGERALGIEAGLTWGKRASKTIVYTNLGITSGMEKGIQRAKDEGRVVEYRELKNWSAV